jgi:hypothetical protein
VRTGLVLFSFKSSRISDEIRARAALRGRIVAEIDAQAARMPVELVVFVNRKIRDFDRTQIEKKVDGRFTFNVFGTSDLENLARPYPHIMWRWFDESPFVRAVSCGRQQEILDALWMSDFPFPLASVPQHPALASILHASDNQRIVGQPGSGKSTLIAQIAHSRPDHTLVVVTRGSLGTSGNH